jgi:hypothetical protein
MRPKPKPNAATYGIDIGKKVFHVVALDADGRPVQTLGDPFIKVHIAEQRPARLVRPAHHHPLQNLKSVKHVRKSLSRRSFSAAC